MDIEEVRNYCLSLPEATEDMPFGEDVLVFRINGKIFLFLWLGVGIRPGVSSTIAIKLPPEMGEELREEYDAVTPAYHMNKKHWSDVDVSRFANEQVEEWIKISYDLVCKKGGKKKATKQAIPN